MTPDQKKLMTLDELCTLTGLSPRTVRYYVSRDAIDKPSGETKASRYGWHHVEQIKAVEKLRQEGYTLSDICDMRQQSRKAKVENPQPGATLHRTEIVVREGVLLSFVTELCDYSDQEMADIAVQLSALLEEHNAEAK